VAQGFVRPARGVRAGPPPLVGGVVSADASGSDGPGETARPAGAGVAPPPGLEAGARLGGSSVSSSSAAVSRPSRRRLPEGGPSFPEPESRVPTELEEAQAGRSPRAGGGHNAGSGNGSHPGESDSAAEESGLEGGRSAFPAGAVASTGRARRSRFGKRRRDRFHARQRGDACASPGLVSRKPRVGVAGEEPGGRTWLADGDAAAVAGNVREAPASRCAVRRVGAIVGAFCGSFGV